MELYSTCCTANHDERFYFDDDYNQGICAMCLEHAEFEVEEDN